MQTVISSFKQLTVKEGLLAAADPIRVRRVIDESFILNRIEKV